MTETKTDTQQQQMLRGTAWMTASNIISRLLGALYIIPWYAWMGKQGDQANALFGQGYNIYALFLLISTAGIPVAIAKQVSKYNTLGKMETSFFLLKRILYYMIGLGLIFGVFMYFASPWMSYLSGETRIWFASCVVFLGQLLFSHPCLFYEAFSKALTI